MEELFASLQEVMYSQQLYKDMNLSRDKVAGILSTNRTYLTETVNRFTGLSFIYYINSFRIDEAIRLLSDPGNDIPIKALASEVGFSSISTFYKFFQATTEMSPAQFRNNIKNG
jgi:AraC-like DNA-binding protein